MSPPGETQLSPPSPRAQTLLALALLYVACLAILGPSLRLSQWHILPSNNQAAGEALSWLDGRLDLTGGRGGDTAVVSGRIYNVFPPLLTILCYAVFAAHRALLGDPVVFPTVLAATLIAVPVPALVYFAFRRSGAGVHWAAVLALGMIAGTCLWPVAAYIGSKSGDRAWIYSIQHVTAQIGLAILLIDLLGKRRLWLGGLGVLIAFWSRQLCVFYALPLLWVAVRDKRRAANLLRVLPPLLVAAAVPMALNWAKFGSPFETGYRYIFETDTGDFASTLRDADGRIQLFSARNIPDHAWHMFVSPPDVDFSFDGLKITGHGRGTALWITTPLALLVLIAIPKWTRDCTRRALLLATLPVIAGGLAWHGPTEGSPGYHRYVLDFLLIWLVCTAPWTTGPRARYLTLACLVWSVFYFYMITPSSGF